MKVIAVPVYRHAWLWSTLSDPPSEQQLQQDWRSGASLQDKLVIACKREGAKFGATVKQQWKELHDAKDGTFRSWLYRLGQTVLSREDPIETFLKSVPSDMTRMEIIYPATVDEAFIRRRVRMVALTGSMLHKRKIWGWGLATLPQLPLIVTPLPNVTLYFCMYRFMSHFQALQGASVLKSALEREDAKQLQQIYRLLLSTQATEPRRRGILGWKRSKSSKELAQQQEKYRRLLDEQPGPMVLFQPCERLDSVTQPLERWRTPLDGVAVAKLASEFELDSLEEHYARAKNRGWLQ